MMMVICNVLLKCAIADGKSVCSSCRYNGLNCMMHTSILIKFYKKVLSHRILGIWTLKESNNL